MRITFASLGRAIVGGIMLVATWLSPLPLSYRAKTSPALCLQAPGNQVMAYSSVCVPLPKNSFEEEYEQVWELIDRYFLYRNRLKNWWQWRDLYTGHLHSPEQAEKAIDTMISTLDDPYTFYRNVSETAEHEELEQRSHVVSSKLLARSIGYIHISTFAANGSADETRAALAKLSSARAYIVDLRGNGGGSVNNALAVFSLLNQSGQFVRTVGVSGGVSDCEEIFLRPEVVATVENGVTKIAARESNLTGQKAMIVLVDKSTKSAAEMLAGALRDNKRAVLVGSRTFGKGIVQRVWQFSLGASVKITSARYFLPGGSDIHGRGLQPDLTVASGARDRALSAAISRLAAVKNDAALLLRSVHGGRTAATEMSKIAENRQKWQKS